MLLGINSMVTRAITHTNKLLSKGRKNFRNLTQNNGSHSSHSPFMYMLQTIFKLQAHSKPFKNRPAHFKTAWLQTRQMLLAGLKLTANTKTITTAIMGGGG